MTSHKHNKIAKKFVFYLLILILLIVLFFNIAYFGFLGSLIKAASWLPNFPKSVEFCNFLPKDSKFECYSRFISSVPKNDSRALDYLANLTAKNFRIRECHFLHHEIGIRLIENMDVVSAMNKCQEFSQCVSGCDHGIGQGLVIKYGGTLIRGLNKILSPANSYRDSKKLVHGMGHYAFRLYENYTAVLDFCQKISDGNENFIKTCIAGASHDKFFHTFSEPTYIDFQKEYNQCSDFKQYGDICKLYLAYGFSSENVWDDINNLDFPHKVVDYCRNFSDGSCYDGVAMGIIPIYNIHNTTMNNSETLRFCQEFFNGEKLNSLSCIHGLLELHFTFGISPDDAFQTCHNIVNQDETKICFSYLSHLYNRKYVPNSIHFCSLVNKRDRGGCFSDFSRLSIE